MWRYHRVLTAARGGARHVARSRLKLSPMLTDDDLDRIRLVVRDALVEAGVTKQRQPPDPRAVSVTAFLAAVSPGEPVGARELYERYAASPGALTLSSSAFGRLARRSGLVAKRHTRMGELYQLVLETGRRDGSVADAGPRGAAGPVRWAREPSRVSPRA